MQTDFKECDLYPGATYISANIVHVCNSEAVFRAIVLLDDAVLCAVML